MMAQAIAYNAGRDVERLLSLQECAELLQVSEATVRRLVRRGELPASKIGGETGPLRVAPADLRAYVERRRIIPPREEE
jgi:excisionase family DNA binding protein